ncbi:MAG: hypothetical protein IT376_12630 [Polyangiaceae bacterium]|nr:hypothetical protein [Polyangiaceae bacterium]
MTHRTHRPHSARSARRPRARALLPLVALAGLGTALAGCDEPLADPALLEDTRVLAARVEVDGAPGRASPAAGELATVRWLVPSPRAEVRLAHAFAVCEAADAAAGVPSCAKPPFAVVRAELPAADAPSVSFRVPDDAQAGSLAVLGVICEDAPPAPGSTEACAPEARFAQRVSLVVPLGTGNGNPDLTAAAVTLGADALSPADPGAAPGEACAQSPVEIRRVRPGATLRLAVEPAPSAREPIDPADGAELEPLRVSWVASAGELASSVAWIEGSATAADVELTAPSAPADGRLVRLWIVARDSRGGVDWTTRAYCAAP